MIVGVEPGLRSLDIGRAIIGLAEDSGVPRIEVVANKVRHAEDLNLIRMERMAGTYQATCHFLSER